MSPQKCPCGKSYYKTLERARNARWRIGTDGTEVPVQYYKCEHGAWHWTRRINISMEGK